jgi:thiamine pyrophosphate-dependent acetolactate synthase large subunit-like protein
MKALPDSAADLIARLLKRRGVTRVFALCGGHIMPIWMRLDAEGIRIIDVRDERAAVHMAQAHAELTGELGVALVTAGPGMTNAITGIANAHVSRAPVLVLSGGNPRPTTFVPRMRLCVPIELLLEYQIRWAWLRPSGNAWPACLRIAPRRHLLR